MTTYNEGTASEVEQAQAIVFLAEVQGELRHRHFAHGLTLRMEVTQEGMNRTRRVHAVANDGTPVTGEDGQYVHPRNDGPKSVAAEIARQHRKLVRQQQEAAAQQ